MTQALARELLACPFVCDFEPAPERNLISHLILMHGFSRRKAEKLIEELRENGGKHVQKRNELNFIASLVRLKEQTGGVTFKCAEPGCSFTTGAVTFSGVHMALKRHRKKQPTHRRLTRAKP